MEYRIIEEFRPYGGITYMYYLQRRARFLWWTYWKTVDRTGINWIAEMRWKPKFKAEIIKREIYN